MKAREFIETRINELYSKFEDIKIRYEYRKITKSHLVEIIPLSLFEGDEAYLEEEANFEDDFESLFPSEEIVFISEDSLTEIDCASIELGYDKIIFDCNNYIPKTEVIGYVNAVELQPCTNYALAA